jgi:hypothetical protein
MLVFGDFLLFFIIYEYKNPMYYADRFCMSDTKLSMYHLFYSYVPLYYAIVLL